MSLDDTARAAGVNPFNGTSDDAVQASLFQKLYDGGALAPTGPEGQQLPPGQQEPPAPSGQPPEQPLQATPPEETAPEGPEYQDLQDYFAQSQVDFDSVLAMPVAVKGGHASLKDLIAAHEGAAEHTQRTQAFSEQQQKWETERQQAQQLYTQNLNFAQTLIQAAHQQLQGEYGQVDWARLARENSAAYNEHWPIFQQRSLAIQQQLANLQQAQQQQFQQVQQQREARRPQEWQRFLAAYPSLKDEKALTAASQQAHAYAKSMGLTQDEINQIDYDSRFMRIIYEASQAATKTSAQTAALKKVRAAPQMSSPGARTVRDPQAAQRGNLKKLVYSKAGRGDSDAQAGYFQSLLDAGA